MFCAPGIIFDGIGCDVSRFHGLCSRSRFPRYRRRLVSFSWFALLDSFSAVPRSSGPVFMYCALGLIFGGTKGVGSRFHVLRYQTHFRLYRGRRVPFSCFALLDSFSTVPRASGRVLMFCASGLIFGGGSIFHVLSSQIFFRQYRVRRVPFSCFARPDSFSFVLSASGPVFMFCAPRHVFGGVVGVASRFNVLRYRTHFRRYRGRRGPFSCFAFPD
jgi:hypothetical protein